MKHGPTYRVKLRRQRKNKTNYRKRLSLLRSGKTRLVVRKTLKNTIVQFVNYDASGDRILASAVSSELKKQYGWSFSTATTPAAYLTGLLAGTRAKKQGINECVLDVGFHVPITGSKLFCVVKGITEAGVNCPHDPAKVPSNKRTIGEHLGKEIAAAINTAKNKIIGGLK